MKHKPYEKLLHLGTHGFIFNSWNDYFIQYHENHKVNNTGGSNSLNQY